jgi:hypothetical protein
MSAGLSRTQRTYHTRKLLKSIQRELSKANVGTIYKRGTPQTSAVLVYEGTGATGGFNISMSWGNMSNGESVGTPRIWLYEPENNFPKQYAGWGEESFEKGIARIKELFTTGGHHAESQAIFEAVHSF